MKIAFYTLGCKVNQYETEALKNQFKDYGHEVVGDEDFAHAYIINTCTVTSLADRKSRQYIRRMKNINPDSVIAVTGCYAQISPEEISKIEGVNIIAGTNEKHKIREYIESYIGDNVRTHVQNYDQLNDYEDLGLVTSVESKSRAYIKIQEGCNRFCSYCIIPYARGNIRSREKDQIIAEVRELIKKGFKELILTGINTALYDGLLELLEGLEALEGDFRIRLSSLEPTVIDKEYVKELFKFKKLCHHLHLSIQSGSDEILMKMNRKYKQKDYLEIVDSLKEFDPLYGITTDIIVGFPGEKERDFNESLKVVEEVEFAKVHGFKFSKRTGTKAATMEGQIDGNVKKNRMEKLIKESNQASLEFFKKNIGSENSVIFEEIDETGGYMSGYSDNYIRVYSKADENLINKIVKVKLKKLFKEGLWAEI